MIKDNVNEVPKTVILNRFKETNQIACIVTSVFGAILSTMICSNYFMDDAYIGFHYSSHFSSMGQLNFNLGENGPFGYTNPGYIFLISALQIFSLQLFSAECISRAIAVISLVFCLSILGYSTYRITGGKNKQWSSFVYMLLSVLLAPFIPYLLPNFFSGLETSCFTLGVFGLMYAASNPSWISQRTKLLASIIAFTFSLRFDAAFTLSIPVIFIALRILTLPNISSKNKSTAIKSIAIGIFFSGLIFGLNSLLTGHIVPLSFAQKKTTFNINTFLDYLRAFLAINGPILLIAVLEKKWRLSLSIVVYYLFIIGFYSYFMEWFFCRYTFPFIFASFLLLLTQIQPIKAWKSWITLPIALFYFAALPTRTLDGVEWISGYRVAMVTLSKIGSLLRLSSTRKEHRVFASYDAGLITYESHWKLIDLAGLTTSHIRIKSIAKSLADLHPTVLILPRASEITPNDIKLSSIFQREVESLPKEYQFVSKVNLTNQYWWKDSKYWYYIYVNSNADSNLIKNLAELKIEASDEIGLQKWLFLALKRIVEVSKRWHFQILS